MGDGSPLGLLRLYDPMYWHHVYEALTLLGIEPWILGS